MSCRYVRTAIFDVDGTICAKTKFNLLTDDQRREVKYDLAMAMLTRLCVNNGFDVIYLSCRLLIYTAITLSQLAANGFAAGDIILFDGDGNDDDYVDKSFAWKVNWLNTYMNTQGTFIVFDDDVRYVKTLKKSPKLIGMIDRREFEVVNFGIFGG